MHVDAGVHTPELIVAGRDFEDSKGLVSQRYDAGEGAVYLIRPDQHIAARWRSFDPDRIRTALIRATAGAA